MGTETSSSTGFPSRKNLLKSLKPRMGTETLMLLFYFLLKTKTIKIIKTPYGDGNSSLSLYTFKVFILKSLKPRMGTETTPLSL